MEIWWDLVEPYLNHGPPRSPRSTWWNPGGTLVEPNHKAPTPPTACIKSNHPDHPAALAEPGKTLPGTLVELSWNLTSKQRWNPAGTVVEACGRTWGGNLVQPLWNPGGTLVEPYLKPFRTTPALAEPGGNLVEPWWNTCGTLVEPYLKSPGPPSSPRRTWWRTLVEPS